MDELPMVQNIIAWDIFTDSIPTRNVIIQW